MISGFTYSSLAPPVFTGQFWDDDTGEWEADRNVLVYLDVPEAGPDELLRYLVGLHELVSGAYERMNEGQKAIWMTTHPLRIVMG